MQTFTLEGYRFMREHAGSSYRPAVETREQGAVRGALELARAEHALGLEPDAWVEWEVDRDADISWMDDKMMGELAREETCVMGATLFRDGVPIGGLYSIHIREPYRADPYRRVVEAELALEAGVCHPLDRTI